MHFFGEFKDYAQSLKNGVLEGCFKFIYVKHHEATNHLNGFLEKDNALNIIITCHCVYNHYEIIYVYYNRGFERKSYIIIKFKEPNTLQPKSTGRTKIHYDASSSMEVIKYT